MLTYVLWVCFANHQCQQFDGNYLPQRSCEVRKGMMEKVAKVLNERGQGLSTYECRQQQPPEAKK